ncbi:MAG: hypothetical protein DMG81_07375 [Acidobacteria bacterium]|nr:MAG: hypothetical protein DMG81_07375 [Acidobacteriota bacterium]
MIDLPATRLRDILAHTVGPTPWYWQTFPAITSAARQRLDWTFQGEQVTLGLEQEPDKVRIALNTYCRPFYVPPSYLGIWCPEGRSIRLACFDPDTLKAFDVAELAGWFKQSADRIYSHTAPVAEFEIRLDLEAGTHKINVPAEFADVEELILPTSYKAMSQDDPAFALFVLYPHAGLVEVLPQKWFTAAQYRVGQQWITRAARDPESHRIVGECHGVGTFLLEEDGCRLERWLDKAGS